MESKKQSTFSGAACVFQKQSQNRNFARSRGYILLFTLWILVAIATSLAIIIKKVNFNANNISYNEFYPIEQRQLINLLNYVIIHSTNYDIEVDPRLLEFDEQQLAEQKQQQQSDKEQNIAFLKELLKETNWDLEIKEEVDEPETLRPFSENTQSLTKTYVKRINKKFSVGQEVSIITLGNIDYQITLSPINSLPNLNRLDEAQLKRYLDLLGFTHEKALQVAATIKDWQDDDDFTRIGGAERSYYKNLHPVSYNPRNKAIRSWQELAFFKGIHADIIHVLRQYFVLHGSHKRVHKDFLTLEQKMALTELTEQEIIIAEEFESNPDNQNSEILIPEYVQQYRTYLIDSRKDTSIALIEITGRQQKIQAIYETKKRALKEVMFMEYNPPESSVIVPVHPAAKTVEQVH